MESYLSPKQKSRDIRSHDRHLPGNMLAIKLHNVGDNNFNFTISQP